MVILSQTNELAIANQKINTGGSDYGHMDYCCNPADSGSFGNSKYYKNT